VYDTVEDAVTGAGMQQSPALHGTPALPRLPAALTARGRDCGGRSSTRAGPHPVRAEPVTELSRSGSARL
jgi:hypothetical protein